MHHDHADDDIPVPTDHGHQGETVPTVRIRVFCTLQFEALHRWKDAPDEVAYLRDAHRHVFHVRCEVQVNHDDRDVEFIMLKHKVQEFVRQTQYSIGTIDWSCERWAKHILNAFQLDRVEVSEDGENGAIVERV